MDDLKRIKDNFVLQRDRYLKTKKTIAELEERIASDTKRLEGLKVVLPQYKQWYEGSQAAFNKVGTAAKHNRLTEMAKIRAELEELSGEKIPVQALDALKEVDG